MNYELFQLINGLAGHADSVDDVVEFAANWLIYAVFATAAGLCLHRRQLRPVALFGAALALAFGMATVLGHVSDQVRPFQAHAVNQLIAHEPGVSMPSDHATAAYAIGFGIFAFLSRRWGAVLVVAATVIGVARVWAGLHYPGDIVAGAVIAGLAVLQVVAFARQRDKLTRFGPADGGARNASQGRAPRAGRA